MPFAARPEFDWKLRTRGLHLGTRTLLMGILNVTPDSFSDGNLFLAPGSALDHALELLDQGADILDLGGESTRPDATPVAAEEEQARVLPVLKSILRVRPEAIVSVDTYHASTAAHALDLGAEIINDVSGLLWDPDMAALLGRERPGTILMHTRGKPQEWSALPPLAHAEVVPLVRTGLTRSLELARETKIPHNSIVLDPGFGFGKRGDENLVLLTHLAELGHLHRPLLIGTSRKRFLTLQLPDPSSEIRMHATTASHVTAILSGAHLLRVHDVPASRAAAAVADAVLTYV